ncbi:MAG: murein hydrolase activator EnvC family protein [Acidimicrobiales bacterium]
MNSRGRWLGLPAAAVFLIVSLLPGARVSGAAAQSQTDRQRDIQAEIDSLRAKVGEASAEEARLLGELDASAATKRELDGKVAELDGQLGVVQRNLNVAQAKLSAAEAEQRGAEERLAEARRELEAARIRLANYAIAAYTGQSDAVLFLTTTLKSQSMDELVAKRSYMRAVGTTQTDVIALDERLKDEVQDLTTQLTRVAREAEVQAGEVAAQRAELQVARDAQAAVQAEVAAEIAHTESLKAEVVSRKDEFQAHEQELAAESAAIEAQLRALAAAQRAAPPTTTPSASGATGTTAPAAAAGSTARRSGGLIPPLDSISVSSPFGYRVHPIYGTTLLHTGVDLAAASGQPIYAAASGSVVTAGWMSGYGNTVVIDHGGGLATLYAHQSALGVSSGQSVTQGQVVGRVGCTGACTGPHLHFEVRVDGTPVDPMGYI